jgi:subtilisin family serine protease
MNNQTQGWQVRIMALVLFFVCAITILSILAPSQTTPLVTNAQNNGNDESLPQDASPFAVKALKFVSQSYKIPEENLVIATDFVRNSKSLATTFQAVSIFNQETGEFYELFVDHNSETIEERATVQQREFSEDYARYGKMEAALFEKLQTLSSKDLVPVIIRLTAASDLSIAERQEFAYSTLAAKYPEAKAALELSGKPYDVSEPALSEKIYVEYVSLMQLDVVKRSSALTDLIVREGFSVQPLATLPLVSSELSKDAIIKITNLPDVGYIFLDDRQEGMPTLESAAGSSRVPAVWDRGYRGFGVRVAILEDTNVDFDSNTSDCPISSNNCFRYPGPTRTAVGNTQSSWHGTVVASNVASNHSINKGIAPEATIVSAGMQGRMFGNVIDALDWAVQPSAGNANIVNTSYGYCGLFMTALDYAYDYYASVYDKLLIVSSGNLTSCSSTLVLSPGLGWNVMSVGAYDDGNDAYHRWSNDTMASFSNRDNPFSSNGDHEKPEVVAPGVSISAVELDGITRVVQGTSFSAPQVAGQGAILMHTNTALKNWPVASRAIIMATAINNMPGTPTGIVPGIDTSDGAGGINVDLSYLGSLRQSDSGCGILAAVTIIRRRDGTVRTDGRRICPD